MKSVQDRLINEMVSLHDTSDPSARLRTKQLGHDYFMSFAAVIGLKQSVFTVFPCACVPFIARGGDPDCEERPTCFVFP